MDLLWNLFVELCQGFLPKSFQRFPLGNSLEINPEYFLSVLQYSTWNSLRYSSWECFTYSFRNFSWDYSEDFFRKSYWMRFETSVDILSCISIGTSLRIHFKYFHLGFLQEFSINSAPILQKIYQSFRHFPEISIRNTLPYFYKSSFCDCIQILFHWFFFFRLSYKNPSKVSFRHSRWFFFLENLALIIPRIYAGIPSIFWNSSRTHIGIISEIRFVITPGASL